MVVAQLPQGGDDRDHIIDIVDAVRYQGVGIVLPGLADAHGAALHVHLRGQIVAAWRVEAAALAHGAADVVVAPVFVPQLSGAPGADAHVVQQVLALRHVRGQPVDAEVDPRGLRRHGAGDQIVGVEDELTGPGE